VRVYETVAASIIVVVATSVIAVVVASFFGPAKDKDDTLPPTKAAWHGTLLAASDADLWLAKLDAGNRVSHKLAPGRHAWVHVAEGEVALNGKKLSGGDAAAISEERALELSATKPAQVLLFDLN